MNRKITLILFVNFLYLFFSNSLIPSQVSLEEVVVELRTLAIAVKQKELLDYLKEKKGWFVRLDRSTLEAYLPLNVSHEEIVTVLKQKGYLVSLNFYSQDVSEQLQNLQLVIENKNKHLAELRKLLQTANLTATLEIELALANVVEEIEKAKGELAFLQKRSAFKKITVHFYEQATAQEEEPYSFSWLNQLGIARFLERF